MTEPIYSPDGAFIWNDTEWVPVSSTNEQKVNMQDSVVGGDVVSNTNIQSSDADVIKAAMDGVVASIKELNQHQIPAEPTVVEKENVGNAQQQIQFAPVPAFIPHQKQSNYNKSTSNKKIVFSKKKAVIAISLIAIIVTSGVSLILYFAANDDLHPVVDRWYIEGQPDASFIQLSMRSDGYGTWQIAEDDNRDGIFTENEVEEEGIWSIDPFYEGKYAGILMMTPRDQDTNELGETMLIRYHVSNNMLVLGFKVDGPNDACTPVIRQGFQMSESSMQEQADLATKPDFCVLQDVDW
jgi:hypothetical protein